MKHSLFLASAALTVALILAGCGHELPKPSPTQMAAGMSRRSNRAPLSLEEIGRSAFGTAFRAAALRGDSAEVQFAPNQDGTPDHNFQRMFLLANGAVPAVFKSEPRARMVRLTAVDPAKADRKLAVFSVDRGTSERVDWMHGARSHLEEIYTLESVDPAFKGFAWSRGK